MQQISIFWFRRDLRLHDNAGLYHALRSGLPVLPLFIFDRNILDDLADEDDARVEFIHRTIGDLKAELQSIGTDLIVANGKPVAVWEQLLDRFSVKAVYTNRDYEPYALERDQAVGATFQQRNIAFHTFKDHVIFEKDEVLKADGTPYTVFTPYSRKWLERLQHGTAGHPEESFFLGSYPTEKYFDKLLNISNLNGDLREFAAHLPSLKALGFKPSGLAFPQGSVSRGLIRNYDKTRDIPGMEGTSRLGVHFRFGTISIREKARHAVLLNKTYLNELIWRDFYSQIMAHFPHVVTRPFRLDYERAPWRDAPEEFEKWKAGLTGYPIVDAGMRQLAATGYMHNRVRMITASFLTKHLLLDWRLGEAWFARKLLDFDLASNSGGWQWAAGCGTDAAPYFRIFNPTEQTKKFDPEYKYIRQWVPEFGTTRYPKPMVDHAFARARCLEAYKSGLKS